MEAALRVLMSPAGQDRDEVFNQGVIARLRLEGAGDNRGFAKSVLTEIVEEREGLRPLRWPLLIQTGLISAAASIGLLLLLQTVIFDETTSGLTRSLEPLSPAGFAARIERSENVHWSESTVNRVRDDGWLSTGLLQLESGTLPIAFNSGATTLIEGPAELSI